MSKNLIHGMLDTDTADAGHSDPKPKKALPARMHTMPGGRNVPAKKPRRKKYKFMGQRKHRLFDKDRPRGDLYGRRKRT